MNEQQDLLDHEEIHNNEDELSTGLKILSFCIPLAGAIIYFVNKDQYPNKAKSACHAALWGFGIGIVTRVILTIVQGS